MGTILSSTKDYNRALAKQPRKSIGLANFDESDIQQQPLVGTLSIPYPVRISQPNDKISTAINEPSHTELKPILNEPIQSPQLPSIVALRTQRKPSITQSLSHSTLFQLSVHNQIMISDPVIIRRSIIHLNKHRQTNNNQLATYPPDRSVVERNGKQFMTEITERMERRYVEIFDNNTGQMRLFEVTDYIPSKTVRSVKNKPQLQLQNGTSQQLFSPRSSMNQRPPSRNIPNGRTNAATPKSLLDFNNLNNRDTVAREFDLYHSGVNIPPNNQSRTAPLPLPLTVQNSLESDYSESQTNAYNSSQSQPNAYNSSMMTPQNQYSTGSYNSQAQSFRPHSPTGSGYNGSDVNSDTESVNRPLTPTVYRKNTHRNNTNVAYGTLASHNSSRELDPFAKTVRTSDHTYTQRPGFNNYAQPMPNNRGFGGGGTSDYAPLPMALNQSNQYPRKDSNAYDG